MHINMILVLVKNIGISMIIIFIIHMNNYFTFITIIITFIFLKFFAVHKLIWTFSIITKHIAKVIIMIVNSKFIADFKFNAEGFTIVSSFLILFYNLP